MPNENRTYYVVCEDNCRFESMTKEQIIAAIAEATGATPTSIDDAFITKVKEINHQGQLRFWLGTSAEYNAIQTKATDVLYILTDDSFADDINETLDTFRDELAEMAEEVGAIPEIQETLDELTADTGWTNSGSYIKYRKLGKTVYYSVNWTNIRSGLVSSQTIALPVALDVPSGHDIYIPVMAYYTSGGSEVDVPALVKYENGSITSLVPASGVTLWNVKAIFSFPYVEEVSE